MSTISKSDLKMIFSRIIDKLEYENIDQIELETDFYWYIPSDRWESFEQTPAILGSLKDDIDSLILLTNDSERFCTYVDFDRTAAVLRAISQKNNAT
ncbi:hypothetical protein [Mucilaginibacter gotjawali]|uniref:Uncharacterized protein n=2 Tax=Mucilaginibacter gotjawali TaxID=1550579 RepID=A0A839SBI2_9SPHI|nr:hypothetical protein [Mucilaginibacter gotjawali]MBB3053947.1 hypothetical protein [Mucilaginibacter gotjawali]BAU54211.1 hypothetical protein MgSA37_02385 [Mucilaginibacter gotjawali]